MSNSVTGYHRRQLLLGWISDGLLHRDRLDWLLAVLHRLVLLLARLVDWRGHVHALLLALVPLRDGLLASHQRSPNLRLLLLLNDGAAEAERADQTIGTAVTLNAVRLAHLTAP